MSDSTILITCYRSRTLKDLNDAQLSKIIDSMEEVRNFVCLTSSDKHALY